MTDLRYIDWRRAYLEEIADGAALELRNVKRRVRYKTVDLSKPHHIERGHRRVKGDPTDELNAFHRELRGHRD